MNIQLKDVDNVVFNGIDVSAVKFNDVLVWRKWETLEYTGAVPVTIYANGEPLIEMIISGNMSQSGTPTPTTPIQPQECGDRTGNLVTSTNYTTTNLYINVATLKSAVDNDSLFVLSIETNIAFAGNSLYLHTDSGNRIVTTLNGTGHVSAKFKLTETDVNNIKSSNSPYFYIYKSGADFSSTSVELHSGYKIPISSGGENLCPVSVISGTMDNRVYVNSLVLENIGQGTYTLTYDLVTTASEIYASSIGVGETTYSKDIQIQSGKSDGHCTFTFTINAEDAGKNLYARFARFSSPVSIDYSASNLMLNLGSTAKPYSPYNRTTTPVYLGEVETERRVKKLVFDGTEAWEDVSIPSQDTYRYRVNISDTAKDGSVVTAISSHYNYYYGSVGVGFNIGSGGGQLYIRDANCATATDFKAYLAAQYANGTPVCVWYVLATPQTAVLNEPLRKIGNYADSLSVSQTIPTVEGENVVDVETTLKPSEVYIKYKGKST